ncbi:MAG: hypothetical protein HKN37_12925 [Rhodothermales bacterium]|nr:hypothetical protein [Rhodothermales bacterium]
MAWTNSKIFHQLIDDMIDNTTNVDVTGGTPMCALFNDSVTPSNTVSAAASAYGAGVWAANEVSEAGQWDAGGVAIAGVTSTPSAGVITVDGTNTASGSAADLANVFGCLVYDGAATTVVDQGICYNYFGGTNSVVNGTFTVIWHANGIFSIDVS